MKRAQLQRIPSRPDGSDRPIVLGGTARGEPRRGARPLPRGSDEPSPPPGVRGRDLPECREVWLRSPRSFGRVEPPEGGGQFRSANRWSSRLTERCWSGTRPCLGWDDGEEKLTDRARKEGVADVGAAFRLPVSRWVPAGARGQRDLRGCHDGEDTASAPPVRSVSYLSRALEGRSDATKFSRRGCPSRPVRRGRGRRRRDHLRRVGHPDGRASSSPASSLSRGEFSVFPYN